MAEHYVSSGSAVVQAVMQTQLTLFGVAPHDPLVVDDMDVDGDVQQAADDDANLPAAVDDAVEEPVTNPFVDHADDAGSDVLGDEQALPVLSPSPKRPRPRHDSGSSEENVDDMDANNSPSPVPGIHHCGICNVDDDDMESFRCATCTMMCHGQCMGAFEKERLKISMVFICHNCKALYDKDGFDDDDINAYGEILDAGKIAMANKAKQFLRDHQINRDALGRLCKTSKFMQVVGSMLNEPLKPQIVNNFEICHKCDTFAAPAVRCKSCQGNFCLNRTCAGEMYNHHSAVFLCGNCTENLSMLGVDETEYNAVIDFTNAFNKTAKTLAVKNQNSSVELCDYLSSLSPHYRLANAALDLDVDEVVIDNDDVDIEDLQAENEEPPIPPIHRVDNDGEMEEVIPIRVPHNRPFDEAAIDEAINPAGMNPDQIARARDLLRHLGTRPQDEEEDIGE